MEEMGTSQKKIKKDQELKIPVKGTKEEMKIGQQQVKSEIGKQRVNGVEKRVHRAADEIKTTAKEGVKHIGERVDRMEDKFETLS